MHTIIPSTAVMSSLLATTATTAPTPPYFPGISFHGVPHSFTHPGIWDYNITATNNTIISPHHPQNHPLNDNGNGGIEHHKPHEQNEGKEVYGLETRNVDVEQNVDF